MAKTKKTTTKKKAPAKPRTAAKTKVVAKKKVATKKKVSTKKTASAKKTLSKAALKKVKGGSIFGVGFFTNVTQAKKRGVGQLKGKKKTRL
tara:strand:+ start:1345 stop:1617 length:273 start_codon:yes stop_codon:yes gene_type:complete